MTRSNLLQDPWHRQKNVTRSRFAGPKSIILSAGQGSRLGHLTTHRPKCLVPVGGKTVLGWQVEALRAAGISRATVVVGFGADAVVRFLDDHTPAGVCAHTLYNPDFDRADNLVSCWAARHEMNEDFLVVNGDTLFEPQVVERLLDSPQAPITLAMATKDTYDADDMKVSHDGIFLHKVGKDLPMHEVNGESIGMILFRGEGPRLFQQALEAALQRPNATRLWYLSVVGDLAKRGLVRVANVDGLDFGEIDYPQDLEAAVELTAGWHWQQGSARTAGAGRLAMMRPTLASASSSGHSSSGR